MICSRHLGFSSGFARIFLKNVRVQQSDFFGAENFHLFAIKQRKTASVHCRVTEKQEQSQPDGAFENLVGRYYTRIGHLHGEIFYEGKPVTRDTERRIRETLDYITDVEALAYKDGAAS